VTGKTLSTGCPDHKDVIDNGYECLASPGSRFHPLEALASAQLVLRTVTVASAGNERARSNECDPYLTYLDQPIKGHSIYSVG
jgi:hypothetical protein